ncbi:MAG: hypothetical protein ACKPKO_56495, partial [Candidatus Fonsibacter sp.]
EPTTVNTDMIISANRVLLGDTIPHTLLSGTASHFYSVAEFHNLVYLMIILQLDIETQVICS